MVTALKGEEAEDKSIKRIGAAKREEMMSLQVGEVVKVTVKRSPYSGATGRVDRVTRSGKSVWVTFVA